jgi:predicted AlkP superfamily pyrophosphatase or phosphodiesterase
MNLALRPRFRCFLVRCVCPDSSIFEDPALPERKALTEVVVLIEKLSTLLKRPRIGNLKVPGAVRLRGIVLTALWSLTLLGCAVSVRSPSEPDAAGRHIVVISVDGLRASSYAERTPKVSIPHILELKKQGSFAEAVEAVYPTVTYPSHMTLVTGRLPLEHGIYTNLSSREPGKNPRDWFWFSNAIKVTTLWDEARGHHLTTAAVSWPVTAGAAIDWDVPEIWDPEKGEVLDASYITKFSTPGLMEEAMGALGLPQSRTDGDTLWTSLAAFLLRRYKPNLLLVHLSELDDEEHQHGPGSPEAAATLERSDARIGELLTAAKESGLETSTDVFIVSDHGFLPIEREIRPNVLLVKAGLLTADDQGLVTGGKVATVSNGGSFFIYWPDSKDLRRQVDTALKPLREQGVLWGILDREAMRDLGGEPGVQIALEAAEGSSFSSRAAGELISKMTTPGGTHGYLPFRKGLEASFIAWGPRIRSGVNLHRIRMTAIGPTILKDLGIDDQRFGSEQPLNDILK